jgi:hypothetical protein
LWIRLTEAGYRGVVLPEVLFRYRRRGDSMSRRMQGPLQVQHYRRLVEGHPDSYRRHLPELVARRERDVCHVTRDILDVCREDREWLSPHVRRLAEDARIARERVAGIRRQKEIEAANTAAVVEAVNRAKALEVELAHAAESVETLQSELSGAFERERGLESSLHETERNRAALGAQLRETERRLADASAAAEVLRGEVADLGASMSWRVTSPLRVVYGWLLRLHRRT